MKKATVVSLIIVSVVLLLACSGSPDGVTPNPPTPIPPGPGGGPITALTDQQRVAVLHEVKAFAETLGDLRSDAAQNLMVTWIKARPEFEDAGILQNNVWARFHDRRLLMVLPDWLDKDSYSGGVAPPVVSGRQGRSDVGRSNGLPTGKKVELFHGLGTAYRDNRPDLLKVFAKSPTQYHPISKEATVQNLLDVENVDVFYINTHGGLGNTRDEKGVVAPTFGLWTSDSVSTAREAAYKDMLDETSLAYSVAIEDRIGSKTTTEMHYMITGAFIIEYMSFGADAVQYIDACSGLSDDASNFKELLMQAAANRSATYIGWSAPSDQATGIPTSLFIFDRLLGSSAYMTEAPLQRPFDLDPTFKAMEEYNLGKSRYGGKLGYESTSMSPVILAPSIEYINMMDYQSQMVLKGIFGDNVRGDGKVSVGGITVPYSSWTPSMIVCELPTKGAGSSGEVFVSVNGHESNRVPLSEWTIPLHLHRDDFGVKIDARLELKLRADAHRFRSKPEEIPKTKRPDAPNVPPGTLGFPVSTASSGTFSIAGQRSSSCEKDGCTMRDTETVVSRSGVIPVDLLATGLSFSAAYLWADDMRSVDVIVVVNIPDTGLEMTAYTSCPKGPPLTTSYSGPTTFGISAVGSPSLPRLHFELDENFNIRSGNISKSENIPWGRCGLPGYFKVSASWPSVTPTTRPTPETASRVAN